MTLFTAVARQRAVLCKTNLQQSNVTWYSNTETVYNKLPSVCTFHRQTSSSDYSYYIQDTSKFKLLNETWGLTTMVCDGMEEQLHIFWISVLLISGKRGPQYRLVGIWVGPIIGLDLCPWQGSNSVFSVDRFIELSSFHNAYTHERGRDSSVGIATGYGLGRSGDRISVGARIFAHVQTDPGAHPASCTMGTGSFAWVTRPGRGDNHPPPLKCRGQESVELYLYPPLDFLVC
jgi:hypothetical protein